jgi:hypothetical protein
MISPTQDFAPASADAREVSLPLRSDAFSFTTMPAATWLTQVMVAQKLAEAVWRQGTLTAEFAGSGSMPSADRDRRTASPGTVRSFQDLRERRDRRARVARQLAAKRRERVR